MNARAINTNLLLLMVSLFVVMMGPLFIKDSGLFSVAFIGVGLLICGLVMAIMQPVVAKWGKLFIANPEKQMAIGFLIAGLTLPVHVLVQTQWIILLTIGIFGLGSSLIVPNLLAQVSLKEPKSSGWALGMQSSFSVIGQIIGPLAGTAFYAFSPASPFYIIGGLMVATSFTGFKTLMKSDNGLVSSSKDQTS